MTTENEENTLVLSLQTMKTNWALSDTFSSPEDGAVLKSTKPEKLRWSLGGRPTCFRGWRRLLGVSTSRIQGIVQAVRLGRVEPHHDGRSESVTIGRPAAARSEVESFLEWAYQNIAETLAEGIIIDNYLDEVR